MWVLIAIAGMRLGKGFRPALTVPIYIVLMPILGVMFELYGIATFNRRQWGGPRSDDEHRFQKNPICSQTCLQSAVLQKLPHSPFIKRRLSSVSDQV
jgi:hypothetical protein